MSYLYEHPARVLALAAQHAGMVAVALVVARDGITAGEPAD